MYPNVTKNNIENYLDSNVIMLHMYLSKMSVVCLRYIMS